MRKQVKICVNLCNPWLNLVKMSTANRSRRNFKTLSESLRAELEEFIRKNDYQLIRKGFGKEGDAWLRAVGMITGSRKEK